MHTSPAPSYKRHRFPAEIISYAVWLYFRFSLSYRNVEELLAERGVPVTYETIRQWGQTFGQHDANQLRHRRAQTGDTWHLAEVFLKINGKQGIVKLRSVTQEISSKVGNKDVPRHDLHSNVGHSGAFTIKKVG